MGPELLQSHAIPPFFVKPISGLFMFEGTSSLMRVSRIAAKFCLSLASSSARSMLVDTGSSNGRGGPGTEEETEDSFLSVENTRTLVVDLSSNNAIAMCRKGLFSLSAATTTAASDNDFAEISFVEMFGYRAADLQNLSVQ